MDIGQSIEKLSQSGNLRILPSYLHDGKYITTENGRMINLSSNDYLGIASEGVLQNEFLNTLSEEFRNHTGEQINQLFTSSSSRLLTGNFSLYSTLENKMAQWFGAPTSLVLGSGYHLNSGLLPAICDKSTLILADKLVHASIIDGIRLSTAESIRFTHQNIDQLERLVGENHNKYSQLIVVVESIYSMDGDVTDLRRLVELKKRYNNVMLYVDEAHAIGVRGALGRGVAEEQGVISEIDLLCGTFGKALASLGAYIICSKEIKEYLVNKMRTLIYTTALPPINLLWTLKVVEKIPSLSAKRDHLAKVSAELRDRLSAKGFNSTSSSHIVPIMVGESSKCIDLAQKVQKGGFYLLPLRPPTVPQGRSRLRVSLSASLCSEELYKLVELL